MIMRRPRSCCLGPLAWRVLAAGVARSRPGREAAAREVAAREAATREAAAARAEARRGSSCGVRPVAPLSPGGSVGRERQPEAHWRAVGAAACEGVCLTICREIRCRAHRLSVAFVGGWQHNHTTPYDG